MPRPLTAPQRAVLEGLLRGERYATIAERLGVTVYTVRYHVREMGRQLEGQDPMARRVVRCAKELLGEERAA